MTTRIVVPILVVFLGASVPSYAALYQFTLLGEVTLSQHPKVSVGDPFTIRYVADSQDSDPRPTVGSYEATRVTASFPNTTVTPLGPPWFPPFLGVRLNDPPGTDQVAYRLLNPNVSEMAIRFTFPAGTVQSDALPLTLPLSSATSAGFELRDPLFILLLRGDIAEYTSAEVPEPSGVGVLLLMMMRRLLAGRRSRT